MEKEAVSLQPSLLLQGDMGMGEPHSLLAMCASVERGKPVTMMGTEEENAKKPTRGKFSNYGN